LRPALEDSFMRIMLAWITRNQLWFACGLTVWVCFAFVLLGYLLSPCKTVAQIIQRTPLTLSSGQTKPLDPEVFIEARYGCNELTLDLSIEGGNSKWEEYEKYNRNQLINGTSSHYRKIPVMSSRTD
jgi:hypothetical protein